MPKILTSCLVALGLSLAFAAPLAAGPLEDAGNAYRDGDFATAASLYPPFAEKGDSWAQFALGWMHYYGRGVPQDFAEAVAVGIAWPLEHGTGRAQKQTSDWPYYARGPRVLPGLLPGPLVWLLHFWPGARGV